RLHPLLSSPLLPYTTLFRSLDSFTKASLPPPPGGGRSASLKGEPGGGEAQSPRPARFARDPPPPGEGEAREMICRSQTMDSLTRSEEHTSELQSLANLVGRL